MEANAGTVAARPPESLAPEPRRPGDPLNEQARVAAGWRAARLGRGLRARLAAFSVALVLVAAGGSAFAGWQTVEGLIRQATTDRLNVASATFQSLYQQRVSDVEIVTRQLTERAGLAGPIMRRNTEQLEALIGPIQTVRPYYSIVVADAQATVLAKLIPPGRADPGPSLVGVPGAQEAIELVGPFTALVRRADCQMIVAVSVPVKAPVSGAVIGLMHLRFPLDDDFLRQVKADTGLDISLYCGDTLVATTVPGQSGALWLQADPQLVRHVMEDAVEWEENQSVSGQTYRTRYVPLLDIEGRPAGMYAVSIPVQTLQDARNTMLRLFLPVVAAIAALAMSLGYLGSALLTRPLRRLATAAAGIGSGDFESPVPVEGDDEVAQLAERMEEMRRSLHQSYSRLRQLNQLKDEYLFSVAHEVRTPLSSLVASVEVLASDYADMPAVELRSTVRRIERAAVRLQTLVENVLDAGSIRAGRFSVVPDPANLAQIVEVAIGTLQPLLDEKRQTVDVSLPNHLPSVLADERRVAQVFANLLANASKYGPEGDRITIRAAVNGDDVLVHVSDHGPGIPLPEQGELFERYFRAASAARSSPGTGLGLAISKAIVEAHGGRVGLQSEPEHGTTVWFTLPVAASEELRVERHALAV